MPRVSAAAKEIMALRLDLPENDIPIPDVLTDERERARYARIYAENPSSHLFTPAVEGLLIQFCRHLEASETIAQMIRDCQPEQDHKAYITLLKAQREESAILSSIATKLRMNPTSIDPDKRVKSLERFAKPWE